MRSLLPAVSKFGRLFLTGSVAFAVVLASAVVPDGVAEATPIVQASVEPESTLQAPALAAVVEEPGAPLRGIDLDGSNRAAPVPGEARVNDMGGVRKRSALPLDGNVGGAEEWLFPAPSTQLDVKYIERLHPPI